MRDPPKRPELNASPWGHTSGHAPAEHRTTTGVGPYWSPSQQQQYGSQHGGQWIGGTPVQLQPHHWRPVGPMAPLPAGAYQQHMMMPVMPMYPMVHQPHGIYGSYPAAEGMVAPYGAAQRPQQQHRKPLHLSSKPPAQKRKRKKDIVPPLEPMTEDAKVRGPVNEAERLEIEAWKSERRKHWPTEENIRRKQEEKDDRRISLDDVLNQQKRLGLTRKAGTEELIAQRRRQSGGGRGGQHGGGRGGQHGGGRGGQHEMEKAQGENGQIVENQSQGLIALQAYSSGEEAEEDGRRTKAKADGEMAQHGKLKDKHTVARASRKGHTKNMVAPSKRRPTLLEMLLAKDIRAYHAKTIQLCQFIYKNNFFDGIVDGETLVFPEGTKESSQVVNDTGEQSKSLLTEMNVSQDEHSDTSSEDDSESQESEDNQESDDDDSNDEIGPQMQPR